MPLERAKAFRPNGTTRFEVLHKAAGVDLAFWIGFQLATVQIGEMPEPTAMKIRVTVKELAQLHASRSDPVCENPTTLAGYVPTTL